MKKSFPLLLLSAIVISVASCKKASHPSNNSGSGTMLSEFVALDTTQAIGSDTLSITYLTYDNLKRLNTVSYIFFTNYVRETASYNTKALFYSTTDTLPNKIISASLEAGPSPEASNDTDYISYDSQGRVVKDIDNGSFPINFSSYTKEEDYSYNGSIVINNQIDSIDGNGRDTVTQTISNGNIISQVDNNTTTCTISLDTHPNPFYKNGYSVTPIFAMYGMDADGLQDGVQKNNCTRLIVNDPSNSNAPNVIHQFTYNANGYPVSVIEYNNVRGYILAQPTSTPLFNFKGIYIYQ
jgi:hypothetical protein